MKYTLYLDKIDGKQTPSSEHTDLTAKTIDVTLENGTTYFWRIKSFDGTNSSFSAVNTFKTNSTDSGSESNSTSGTNSSQEQVKEVSGNLIKNGTFETGSISPWGGFKGYYRHQFNNQIQGNTLLELSRAMGLFIKSFTSNQEKYTS